MWSFGIVPDHVVGKSSFESLRVIEDSIRSLDAFFLDGAVESFNHAVDFRRPGIDELMDESFGKKICVEDSQKLTAIVGLERDDGRRELMSECSQHSNGLVAGDTRDDSAVSIAGCYVNKAHKIPPISSNIEDDGIHLDMTRSRCLRSVLAAHSVVSVVPFDGRLSCPKPSVFLDHFSNGCCGNRGNLQVSTIRIQEWFDLVFTHGIVALPDTLNKCTYLRVGLHLSEVLGSSRNRNQRSYGPLAIPIAMLPVIEGTLPNTKRGDSCFPSEISGVLNHLKTEGNGVMGVIYG